ncbi:MAG: Gfo/Idh/MocA family oxidoreductase [Planctomycetaceae bacterium]|nr:Gfo/Idh/MocA family oxidoreductase [Planctomycetaceae bacterium]
MTESTRHLTADRSRRGFLKASGVLAGAAITLPIMPQRVHASGSDILKIGLIGCGGRGRGAAVDALSADPNTELYAVADVFPERTQATMEALRNYFSFGERITATPDRCFEGFDAYQKLIATEVDVVLIAAPTYFHPHFLKASIEAGKHTFCEKTHAVDSPGVRMVLEATALAKEKKLSVVSGLAWRYDTGAIETIKRVHDGEIGEIIALEEICNTGSLPSSGSPSFGRSPERTEMQYQIDRWYNFTWLSCDLPGLNLVHHVDKASWAMKDETPISCWGTGGRQTRTASEYGQIWDHHAIVFEYANGVRLNAYCRQQNGTYGQVTDRYFGTKGMCDLLAYQLNKMDANRTSIWRFPGGASNRFLLEQDTLLKSIRSGNPVNNGRYMAHSSLMAIMATWACYTGVPITWDEAMNSEYVIGPASPNEITWETVPPVVLDAEGEYPGFSPGITPFPMK